ncbi:MAG: TonB-dependent receptor, partial [Acidobacteriaceae bacterium]|nr:TonB-dependent receptor [Acidobacteriaceae bacterium]
MRHQVFVRTLILGLFFAFCLCAQRDLSTVLGTVTDPQGGVVPNAKIIITEDATGVSYDVTTNAEGEFIRPLIKPGMYTVSVEATGFKKAVQKGVELTAGGRTAVPITLSVGEISQSVEITASAPLLQTESTIIGQDLNTRQTSELPLGGTRVFTFLARLSPGVVPGEPGARDEAGGSFSANGVRSNGQNNFLLNGVDNNVNVIDFLNQSAFVVGPSVDAIGEMTILTNGYNAEYGRGAGGVVNVTLKSGTNEYHGTLFEYLQNDDLNANTWENNKNATARASYKQNQFGATFGGPIFKNKLFFFADYQGTRIASNSAALNLGIGGNMTIPTPAEISGNFSQVLTNTVLGTDARGNTIYQGQIFDPNSTATVNGQPVRTPFPGNIIPPSRLDPASAKIAALFPKPNTNFTMSGAAPTNDYFIVTPVSEPINQGDARVDYHISDKDTLFGSMSWSERDQSNGPPLPGALDATYFASAVEQDLARNAMLSYTRVWSPTFISETRVAFTRLVTSRTQAYPNVDQFKAFGIGGY